MDVASGLAFAGAEEGTVVVADEQTAGRGRRGSRWVSPPGGSLYLSVILRPGGSPESAQGLSFAAAVAVADCLNSSYELPARLKWPNDILIGEKKIAGVLVEALLRPGGGLEAAIVGIGLNVNWSEIPPEIRHEATCMSIELEGEVDLPSCMDGLLRSLEEAYDGFRAGGLIATLTGWRRYDCTIGSQVKLLNEDGRTLVGTAVDVTPYGALVVETAGGYKVVVHAGQVQMTSMTHEPCP